MDEIAALQPGLWDRWAVFEDTEPRPPLVNPDRSCPA